MAGFQVDMSPLINSSMVQAQATQGIGQALGGGIEAIGNAYQQTRQQDAQTALNDLTSRAMGGDAEAFQQLMTQSPDNARQVATYLRQEQDQKYKVGQQDKKAQMIGAAELMERMHLDPTNATQLLDKAILDKTNDINEDDRSMFMSLEGQKAFIGNVKGVDYANTFFGGGSKFDVQSSKILEDGSIIAIGNDGTRQVRSSSGKILTGAEAAAAIKESSKQSHQRKIELKRLDQTIKKAQLGDDLLNDQQKGIQTSNIKRLSMLANTSSGRSSAIKKATKFKEALASGKVFSGAGRKAAGFVPGVFTSQGQFDEEFNAFAEVAARQQLKASGETRPTDADVQGMKQAMFGVGRDEKVNVQLLEDFINDQLKQDSELDQLIGAGKSGDLSSFTYLPSAESNADASELSDEDLFK